MTPIPVSHRVAGCGLVFVGLLLAANTTHVWLEVVTAAALIIGGALITRAWLALSLCVTLLAGVHVDLNQENWGAWLFYPGLTLIAGLTTLALLCVRFSKHIEATRSARWANRQSSKS